MFNRIKTLVTRWHELKEIDAMTDRDLDDLGMTRDQVTSFARMPHDVPDRVAAMGAIFGIPEADLKRDYAHYMDLLLTCGTCADRRACSLVLAKGELAHPSDCGFCLNRGSLATLAA